MAGNIIKTFFKKIYALFIASIIKTFDWFCRPFRRQTSNSYQPKTDLLPSSKNNSIRAEKKAAAYAAIEQGEISLFEEYLKEAPQGEREAQLDTIVLHPVKERGDFYLLLYAIKAGHIEIVKRTLSHLTAKQHTEFYSPYRHYASIVEWTLWHSQNKEIIQALLAHYQAHLDSLRNAGYKPYAPGTSEEDLFQIAVGEANNIAAAKILIHNSHVKRYLNYKYRPNYSRGSMNSTALYYAMKNKNPEMADFLMDAGVTLGQRLYREKQLELFDNYIKHITLLYNKALECLDPMIPEKGVKNIIVDYAIPYKKHITFLYNKALECLDPMIPDKEIKDIIVDYAMPYLEPTLPPPPLVCRK